MSLDACVVADSGGPAPLPPPDGALLGRTAEIARLTAMVAAPGLVTVTGEGGVGKTRLVLEVARRESRTVHFVPLADLDRTGATLAIRRECAPLLVSRFDAATGALRDAVPVAADERPRLLVLDSVEQVGQISDLIAEIRGTVGHLTILVTSRSRLGLSHERVLHLSGLPTTADGPAVELFLARSVAVGADPQGLLNQVPAIASLCRALDGVPLAIELAAARTRMMSPTALLAQLQSPDHRRLLTLLAKGPADLPTRQLSMRATLAWSHRLLAPEHQILFRRLGALPGSFSLDAAEAIAVGTGTGPDGERSADSAEIVLDGITEMVDLHLLEPVASVADPEPVRFAMSDVVRAFAAELLAASDDGPRVQHRLTRWCLDLLGRAERGITSADEAHWLDRIELEMPTIRQGLAACAADGDGEEGLSLCVRLGEYWVRRGSPTEGIEWLRTFLDIVPDPRADGGPDERLRRLALGWWARLAISTGDPSRIAAIRAVRPAAIDRHRSTVWFSWTDHLVMGLLLMGEHEECGLLIADGLGAAQEYGDSYWACMFLMRRALLRWMVVRCTEDRLALQWARMAHVAATDCGLLRLAARSANLTALSLMAGRDWAGADRLLTGNLEVLRAAGDAQGLALARNMLGIAMIELDRPTQAAGHLIEAITQARRCDDRVAEVAAAWAVSFLAYRIGRPADAAIAIDTVTGNSRLLERAIPAPVVDDFRRARAASPACEPLAADRPGLEGWGWLSGWALGIATDVVAAGPAGVGPIPALAGSTPEVAATSVTAAITSIGGSTATITDPIGTGTAGVDGPPARPAIADRSPTAAMTPAVRPTDVLTARELEILAAIASGRTNAQIAGDFFLSTKTVMHHSVSIYRKLDVRGRAEAVALAYRTGLLRNQSG